VTLSDAQRRGRETVPLQQRGDARGQLLIAEVGQHLPFSAQRVYFMRGMPAGSARGHHAHRALQQFALAISGAVTLHMDDGRERWQVRLDSGATGLCIPPMVWHEMHDFSGDCVLLVLASEPYKEADYIRERREFEELTRG
jgi:dTDP-4-dehydrorhamnose 3,5-epimerase-like enzyme